MQATEEHTGRKRRNTQEGNLGTYGKEIANMQEEMEEHTGRKYRNMQKGNRETHKKEI
jgi:hypothetical protein